MALYIIAGADLDAFEIPILHIALRNGFYKTTQLLIFYGAEVSAVDKRGNTALTIAASQISRLAFETLINHGASIYDKNEFNDTILQIAAKKENREFIEILFQHDLDLEIDGIKTKLDLRQIKEDVREQKRTYDELMAIKSIRAPIVIAAMLPTAVGFAGRFAYSIIKAIVKANTQK